MKSGNRQVFGRIGAICTFMLAMATLFSVFAPRSVYAQVVCRCSRNLSTGVCFECPTIGGGGPIVNGPGGPCDGCQARDPWLLITDVTLQLDRSNPVVLDLQTLFPDRELLPGDRLTVMLTRDLTTADGTLLQPLLAGESPAMYEIVIDEDGVTEADFGILGENALGGAYTVLAIPQQVDTLQAFWDALQSGGPDNTGWQRYNVDALVPLAGGATVSADGRQIEFLTDVDPAILPNLDVDVQVRREGQPLPQAENPLQPGVFDTLAPAPEPGAMHLYAPGEYALQTYAPALAPMVSPYLGAYFTPGEYEVDVTINGVLESTTSFVIP